MHRFLNLHAHEPSGSSSCSLWGCRCLLKSANSLVNLRSASSLKPHRARVSTSHLSPVLPLSSSPLAPVVTRGAPVCCGCMLMRPIHLFVCVIWTLLVSTLHVPISTSHISFFPLLLLPPVPRSSPSLKHPGACLPGSLPALACSGWVWDQRPLAACMQISRVVMKSRLHPSLTSR